MRSRLIFAALAICTLFAITAAAQTPRDVQDLVGARAAGGESQLMRRGYSFVKTQKGDDRAWSNWWNRRTSTCITVVTRDGRYDSITTSPAFDCNRSGSSGGGFGGGDRTSTPPRWAQGTFYSNNPRATLTIDPSGRVTSLSYGRTTYGRYYLNRIYLDNDTLTVSRYRDGIRTYNARTRQTTDYSPNSYGGDRDRDRDRENFPRRGRPTGIGNYVGPIVSKNSGKCLDVKGESESNKANVQQYRCNGGDNQIWEFVSVGRNEYAIYSANSSKVLDVEGESRDDKANIQQYAWNGGGNQRWRIERRGGWFQIRNVRSGKCLDVFKGQRQNEANVIQFRCTPGADEQLWRIGR
jgi:hypothetical protein